MPRVPGSFYEPDGDHYVATELTRGPWDAETFPEASGVGMADTQLLDECGQIGRAVQTLLVAER
jgi:hypothetical protein